VLRASRSSRVITYKGRHVNSKQIGRELSVRYILEGSVQRSGNRLRVNVQLIDADTGAHLWAERFDKPLACHQLGAQLITADARRAEQAPHPDSMDLYFQGRACLNKGWNPERMTQARDFFERALAQDPNNIEALLGTSFVDYVRASSFFADERVRSRGSR
jgi:hypothetical protein